MPPWRQVLHVINGLGTGGAERSLAEMLQILPQHDVESVVAVLHHRPEGVEAAVVGSGTSVRAVRGGRGPARIASLRRIIAQERA